MSDLPAAARSEDIDSKIADFMADIDEIVLGKKSTNHHEQSEWKECFDETSQSVYYWNSKTNDCSWELPAVSEEKPVNSINLDEMNKKKRPPSTVNNGSPKKLKKPSLIAEYTSSESASSEEEDDIDELLDKVLDKEEKVDFHPLFEENCRAAIARLTDLSEQTKEIFTLRIQLEKDCLVGHLSKSYAVSKLEQTLIQIEEFERAHLASAALPVVTEPVKAPLTTSEMALLLSLPPPPPPPSPPPPPTHEGDTTLQLFYAQLNCEESEPIAAAFNVEKTSMMMTKSDEQQQLHHHQHHHHKDKKSKPSKTMPTDLIQKWTHAQQELHGIADIDDS